MDRDRETSQNQVAYAPDIARRERGPIYADGTWHVACPRCRQMFGSDRSGTAVTTQLLNHLAQYPECSDYLVSLDNAWRTAQRAGG